MSTISLIRGVRMRAATVVLATAGLVASGVVAAAPALASTVWYVGGTGASDANTCLSPSTPCATVAGTLAKSTFVSGDTIDVAEGVYAQRPVFSTKGANLVGLGNGATFDGGATGTASTMAVTGAVTVGLTNITLRNGSNTGSPYGGNLRIQAGTVNATNVTITGGASQDGAGVIQYPNTTFTMNGGSIANNTGSFEGGALYSASGTTTLTNVAVSGDTAPVAGGAITIATAASTFTMNGGTISGGTATNGGAVYNVGTATFNGTSFTGNTANGGNAANGGNGGAIFNIGNLTLANASFSGNKAAPSTASSLATGWGGALFSGPSSAGPSPKVTITNTTISGGSVTGGNASIGGAIANTGNVFGASGTITPSALTATGLTLSQNVAAAAGGLYQGGTATITGSTIQNNKATSASIGFGGGIYAAAVPSSGPQPQTTIDSTTISANTANLVGGGLATTGAAVTTIRNGSAVDTNTASSSGGGIYSTGALTLTASDLSGNTSAYQGGGLYNGGGSSDHPAATLTGVTIDNNAAANVGGGVDTITGATLSLSGGDISNNSAIGGGGLAVGDNGSANLSGTTLTGNSASTNGGGAILNAGSTTVTRTSITGNHGVHTTGSTGVGAAIFSGSTASNATITLRVTQSTIANNDGYAGAALATSATGSGSTDNAVIDNSTITGNTNSSYVGSIETSNPVTITNSTITNNTATSGNGATYSFNSGPISFAGDIIAGNSGAECTGQSALAVVDGGHNLIDSAAHCGLAGSTLTGAPQLGPLADNGGPTQTELPGPASPALDRIPANTSTGLTDPLNGSAIVLCGSGATDQRGTARPQGAKCDIGSVEVVQAAPTVAGPATATYSDGVSGSAITFTSTGTPQPTLTESGALPAGVTFHDNGDGTATISGTPNAPGGQYPITVTATNEAGLASTPFTLVLNQAPSLTGPSSATYTVGTAGAPQVFSQSGGYPVATLSTTSTLPSGVTFTPGTDGTATIAGTPAGGTGGIYPITITGDNGTAPAATLPFTLTVDEAPAVSGPSSATFLVGSSGSSGTFSATGFPVPTLTATGLPAGLALTSTGSGQAQITGTPAVSSGGVYNLTVKADNGVGTAATTPVQVTVNEAPAIQGSSLVRFIAGAAGTTVYTTYGYPAPSLSESGTLPSGVTFVDNGNGTATLAGTAPTSAEGTYTFTITAHNSSGADATEQVTLQIVPPLTITTTSLGGGTYGTEYGATIQATGGVAPYTATVVSGSLPGGLTLASNGTISGMPTAAGTSTFTVQVADSNTPTDTATATYTITIAKGTTTLVVNPVIVNITTTITGSTVKIAHVSAKLTGGSPATGIGGATIVFKAGTSSTVVCTATTDSTGAVTCTLTAVNTAIVILDAGVTATYAGDANWKPSSGYASTIN